MKYKVGKTIGWFILLMTVVSAKAIAGNGDSVYQKVERAVRHKINEQQRKNEQLKRLCLPRNYIVYVTEKDIAETSDQPVNVISLTQKNTQQSDVDNIWNFGTNEILKTLPTRLEEFSKKEGYDYYLVVCAIYNLFEVDEASDFSNISWVDTDFLKSSGKDIKPATPVKKSNGYKDLFNYLIDKFNKTVTKSRQPHIYHFVISSYVPAKRNAENKIYGKLLHYQGLYYSSLGNKPEYDSVWKKFYRSKQAELGGSDAAGKAHSKEEWLASFVKRDMEMIASIRSFTPDDLIKITVADELLSRIKTLPDEIFEGFSEDLRIHVLRVLSGIYLNSDAEQTVCKLIEQTPATQADALIDALRQPNPSIGLAVEAMASNPKRSWCLLQCITEETEDSKILLWGNDNYQRLIKALIAVCYQSNSFKQKAEQLNDSYLNAGKDNIPDRVIFYTYNSMWSKIAITFKPGFNIPPKIDWNTSYYKDCQLQTKEQLFFSYVIPNVDIKEIILDPFEPIVFEHNADLGMLADFNESPAEDHIMPAIILKYADEKAGNQTLTDAAMAAIDVSSLATGYVALKTGVSLLRKAWVLFDMVNSGINLVINAEAYASPNLKAVLVYYNAVTGLVALSRMGVGAARNIKNYYQALKALKVEKTAMDATAIRNFLASVKKAGSEMKNLSVGDAAQIEGYLNKLKAEATARKLTNFEKSVDESLAILKGVKGAGKVLGSIVKNGSKIEYTNPAGKLLKWTEQGANDITNSINAAKNSSEVGRKLEGTVADFIKGEGKTIEGFGLKVKGGDNIVATDIDVLTSNEIIEIKNSYGAWDGKRTQVNRFTNSSLDDFVNPYNKKAILYIETPLTEIQKTTILKTIPNNVSLVNSLNELKLILK